MQQTAVTCPSCNRDHTGSGKFCTYCGQSMISVEGVRVTSVGKRFVALLLDIVLFFLTLIIGYIIWTIIVWSRGQSPGKQIMNIYVMKDTGRPATWGTMLVREFLVKGLLVDIVSAFTIGIFWVINLLWPLWDKDRQALHDKIVSTYVVEGTRP